MKSIAMLFAVVAFALPLAARAELKTHAAAHVEMDVPVGWKIGGQGDVMTITDPKQEVGLMLAVLDAGDLGKATAAIDEKLKSVVSDVHWGAPQPQAFKLNGMDAIGNKGEAKIHGKDAAIGVVVVKTPSGKLLLVFGGVDAGKKALHQSEIDGFMASIKPAR